MTCDMWHVTRDVWHMIHDRWGEVNLLSKFQLPSCSLWEYVKVFWRYFHKGSLTDLINFSINYNDVCRTAPATPGLFKSRIREDVIVKEKSWVFLHPGWLVPYVTYLISNPVTVNRCPKKEKFKMYVIKFLQKWWRTQYCST